MWNARLNRKVTRRTGRIASNLFQKQGLVRAWEGSEFDRDILFLLLLVVNGIVDDIVRCTPVHRQLLFLVLVTATVWWSIWDYFCICLLPAFSFGDVRLLGLLAKVQNRFCIPNIRSIFPLSNDIKLHVGSLGSSSDLDLCGHFPKSSNSVFYNLDRTDSFTKVRYLYVYWAMNMETE